MEFGVNGFALTNYNNNNNSSRMGSTCCQSNAGEFVQDTTGTPSKMEKEEPKIPPNTLLAPSKAYALVYRDKTIQKQFPDLVSLAQKVKNEQKFQGVLSIVKGCPLYYLQNMGCFYQGQWKDQLPHGCGVAVYKNNSYYQGEFNQGELQTEDDDALLLFGNRLEKDVRQTNDKLGKSMDKQSPPDQKPTYYIGRFKVSKFNGKGKMHHRGLFYDGEWEDGKRSGQGKEYNSLLSYWYNGTFSNGFKSLQGVYNAKVNNEEYTYTGSFYCGLFHGRGELTIEGKSYYNGQMLNGRADGKGELVCDIGKLQCHFKRDRVLGEGEFIYNDQSKQKLTGEFTEQIYQNPQGKKMRKIKCNTEVVAQSEYIDFRDVMVDV